LAQGCPGITKGTNTIIYLSHSDICKIPQDRTVTYARIVIDHRTQKEDPNRVRITVGGNLIDYLFELTRRTADMVSSKILWNSVISTKDARFAGANIKNMYLETPLDWYEYMKMPIALFPTDIIEHYKFNEKVLNGYVYMEIRKGILFRLGGQLTFSIFYLHTQINTTFHVGITPTSTKILQKKPSFEARPSVTAPPPPLPPPRTAP
jgi:hypothetical protein